VAVVHEQHALVGFDAVQVSAIDGSKILGS
jgi:hypothetical protein